LGVPATVLARRKGRSVSMAAVMTGTGKEHLVTGIVSHVKAGV
jgi:hypothetical protein